MDPANRPSLRKTYPDAEVVPLPQDFPESTTPAAQVLSGMAGPGEPGVLDLHGIARLLFFSAGVTRPWKIGGTTMPFRAAPSAGALYPVEVYVACGDRPDLAAGLYHFDPIEFRLQRLRDRDVRAAVATAAVRSATPCTFVLTGIPWRTAWKYGLRGYRHLFWDAGTILAHLHALADAAGLEATVLTGFDDGAVSQLLGLDWTGRDTGGELPLALLEIGPPTNPAGSASALDPVPLDVEALSPRPETDEEMIAVHREASLGHDEVAAWRRSVQAAARPAGASPPATTPGERSVDEVVLRRGSTRQFSHGSVPGQGLSWALGAAAWSPLRMDVLSGGATLLEHHVAVHAVEGVRPGTYQLEPEGLRRLGDIERTATAHLCLDQPLGGGSAYTAFHGADLDALLHQGGPRAYRAAQLEAGIRSGRLQLAAFTVDLGATGLTFYDDEVSRQFATRSEPMTVTAVGNPAYRGRPGTRPAGT